MIEKVRYLFLSISLIFLLGHTFVPHTHEHDRDTVQIRSCQHAPPQSLGDLLASLFLQDLGSEHLTNFKPATDADATVATLVLFIGSSPEYSFSENPEITEEFAFLPYQELRYKFDGLRLADSRGSPHIMNS
jgi:hypothetical protein